jgi:hypothetical protein
LRSAARQRLTAGQDELDLGLHDSPAAGGPLAITSTRPKHLWDALCRGFDVLGFGEATGGDEVFRQLVLARIIEPTSKLDSLRVLGEAGIETAAACAAHAKLGPASLVLYDVSTLYFEIDEGDGFREPGFSNYAEVVVMPRSPSGGWCSGWSAAGVGVVGAA